MCKNEKGFTLIELLVVIAIIGILASIVIVSVSSSRTKANRAAIEKEVKSAQAFFNVKCMDSDISFSDLPSVTTFSKTNSSFFSKNCGSSGDGTWSADFRNSNNTRVGLCTQDGCTV